MPPNNKLRQGLPKEKSKGILGDKHTNVHVYPSSGPLMNVAKGSELSKDYAHDASESSSI